jgi:hypothetical protein
VRNRSERTALLPAVVEEEMAIRTLRAKLQGRL